MTAEQGEGFRIVSTVTFSRPSAITRESVYAGQQGFLRGCSNSCPAFPRSSRTPLRRRCRGPSSSGSSRWTRIPPSRSSSSRCRARPCAPARRSRSPSAGGISRGRGLEHGRHPRRPLVDGKDARGARRARPGPGRATGHGQDVPARAAPELRRIPAGDEGQPARGRAVRRRRREVGPFLRPGRPPRRTRPPRSRGSRAPPTPPVPEARGAGPALGDAHPGGQVSFSDFHKTVRVVE